MRRRDFIALCLARRSPPLSTRAQQPSGFRRIGILETIPAELNKANVESFRSSATLSVAERGGRTSGKGVRDAAINRGPGYPANLLWHERLYQTNRSMSVQSGLS